MTVGDALVFDIDCDESERYSYNRSLERGAKENGDYITMYGADDDGCLRVSYQKTVPEGCPSEVKVQLYYMNDSEPAATVTIFLN